MSEDEKNMDIKKVSKYDEYGLDKKAVSYIKKKNMIVALIKTLGVITPACKMCSIARSTHYDWIELDKEYKKAFEDCADIALDFAESKLHKQISNDNPTCIIFYLKTKGRNRGYIERFESKVDQKTELSGEINIYNNLFDKTTGIDNTALTEQALEDNK